MSGNTLQRLELRVDSMSMRERVMIFVCVIVAVLLAWYQFAMTPVLSEEERTLESINAARERIHVADQAVNAQAAELDLSDGSSLTVQLEETRRRTDAVEAQIKARAVEIVDPQTMARVLEDMLKGKRGLRLVRARNRKAERLAESDGSTPLYRHTLQLELEGPYLVVLGYLEDLEALPWRIYWQGIEIDAKEFPRNRVRIDVSTLSFDEDWIGV